MAKFCANCGNQMMDNAVVCPACGAPAEAQTASPAAPAVKKIDPKVLKLGGIAVAAVAVIAIVIAIIVGAAGNYKKAVNNWLDYELKSNIKSVEKLAPKAYWEFCKESGQFDVDNKGELEEIYQDYLDDNKEDLEDYYGEKIKYSYKVTKEKELSKKVLSKYGTGLKKEYNISTKDVKAGFELDLEIKVSGKDDEKTIERDSVIVLKIDGSWYVVEKTGEYTDEDGNEYYTARFTDRYGAYDKDALAEYQKEKEESKEDEE